MSYAFYVWLCYGITWMALLIIAIVVLVKCKHLKNKRNLYHSNYE